MLSGNTNPTLPSSLEFVAEPIITLPLLDILKTLVLDEFVTFNILFVLPAAVCLTFNVEFVVPL